MSETTSAVSTAPKPSPRFLIPCRVVPGMFRDEWLVFIDAVDPKNPGQPLEVQMWADARDVVRLEGTPTRQQPVKGWVKVERAGFEDGLALIVLPQFAQPVGTKLRINKDLVEQEEGA